MGMRPKKRFFQHTYRERKYISTERYERLVKIYDYIKAATNNTVEITDLMELVNMSHANVFKDVQYLTDMKIIKRIGKKIPYQYEILKAITELQPEISTLSEYMTGD